MLRSVSCKLYRCGKQSNWAPFTRSFSSTGTPVSNSEFSDRCDLHIVKRYDDLIVFYHVPSSQSRILTLIPTVLFHPFKKAPIHPFTNSLHKIGNLMVAI
jgi:hypothetical protein